MGRIANFICLVGAGCLTAFSPWAEGIVEQLRIEFSDLLVSSVLASEGFDSKQKGMLLTVSGSVTDVGYFELLTDPNRDPEYNPIKTKLDRIECKSSPNSMHANIVFYYSLRQENEKWVVQFVIPSNFELVPAIAGEGGSASYDDANLEDIIRIDDEHRLHPRPLYSRISTFSLDKKQNNLISIFASRDGHMDVDETYMYALPLHQEALDASREICGAKDVTSLVAIREKYGTLFSKP